MFRIVIAVSAAIFAASVANADLNRGEREMRKESKDTTWSRGIVLLVGVFVLAALASGNAALAGSRMNAGIITVSGDSELSDCGEPGTPLALELTGSLEGCWSVFPDDFTCEPLNGFDLYRETGREVFDGKWTIGSETLSGEFDTTYVFEAVFEPGFCDGGMSAFETQLAGGCIHSIKGRTLDFKGVSGQINFFDIIGPRGATNFLYAGQLNRGGN